MESTESGDDMRRDADWMCRPADDKILESLREHPALTPMRLGEVTGLTNDYAGERCRELCRHGLAERLAFGVYAITGAGEAWLDEELDASDLEKGPVD